MAKKLTQTVFSVLTLSRKPIGL